MLWDVSGVIWSPKLPQDAESGSYWPLFLMSAQGVLLTSVVRHLGFNDFGC